MKRFISIIITFVMLLSMVHPMMAAETDNASKKGLIDLRDYLFQLTEEMDDEEYCQTVEKNYRVIKNFEPLFTEDSFKAFNKKHRVNNRENAKKCDEAVDQLVQILSVEEGIWYLWDKENMPLKDGEELTPEQIDEESMMDYAEFIPFIIKYLQDDPSEAVGNIVMCSGGGYTSRGNPAEGYPSAKIFHNMGYNVFLLQRRIEPYSMEDIWMDMQRAIRMVRYYADKEGYGSQDLIAGMGWSGGGGTLMGALENLYGYLTPADVYDSDYIPDEIDKVSADLDVALPIYGVGESDSELIMNNPNIPAFYLCAGETDTYFAENSEAFYEFLTEQGIPAQVFIVPGAEHGFGPGGGSKGGVGSEDWPNQANEFMQNNRGRLQK